MITGNIDAVDVWSTNIAGADGCTVKYSDYELLLQTIHNVLPTKQ